MRVQVVHGLLHSTVKWVSMMLVVVREAVLLNN
jgi:hypothetical protein